MSKKLIIERYTSVFEKYYSELGYIMQKKVIGFIKNEFNVNVGPNSVYPGCVVLRPSFKITNPAIYKIQNEVFPKTSCLTFKRTQTSEFAHELGIYDERIDSSPFNFSEGNLYYSIEVETDLEPIFEDHKYYVERVVFPFFEKISTVEGIDAFINGRQLAGDDVYFESEERQKFLQRYNGSDETFVGLIAAKLINSPECEELKRRYIKMWSDIPYTLNRVEKLIDYLDRIIKINLKNFLTPLENLMHKFLSRK